MAKVGRPKLVENMEPWEVREHGRREAMKHLTPEQRKALDKTLAALRDFWEQWSEEFDLHNPETPRDLQSAFWQMHNCFPKD